MRKTTIQEGTTMRNKWSKKHRTRASIVVASIVTAGVGLCAVSAPAADASTSGGSATSGTVNWWGWTPVTGLAQLDIAAFNKQYPHIKVIYKNFPDNAYTAGLRPALLSGAGPDVFDVATNGAAGAFPQFAPYALNLTPAMERLRGSNWKKGLYAPGITDFTQNGQLKVAQVGRVAAGFRWINLDLFKKVQADGTDHTRPVGERMQDIPLPRPRLLRRGCWCARI